MGVRPEFESIRSRLLHGSTLTLAHALSDLLTEETHLWSMSTSHLTLPHNVLAAYRSGSKSNDNSSNPCVHCQKTNRSDDCFIKYPEKLAIFHARRAARGCGPPLPSGASMTIAAISPAASSVPHPPSTSASRLLPRNPRWFWPSVQHCASAPPHQNLHHCDLHHPDIYHPHIDHYDNYTRHLEYPCSLLPSHL
jgi:hypothetical protein